MMDELIKEYGKIDILVNNAGITKDGLLMAMSEEDFDQVIQTNLKGAFHCMRFVSRYMLKKRSGSIVNISSVSGIFGNPGQVNYSASKAGIIGMTKAAARELAARNIRVNAVAPGFVQSDMTDKLSDAVKEAAKGQIAMGRFGTPGEIANVVAFLAGDESSYVTGQVIRVDGGM
jgi:3-oxoacyl-[acyl-carrier protein] reductase